MEIRIFYSFIFFFIFFVFERNIDHLVDVINTIDNVRYIFILSLRKNLSFLMFILFFVK